MCASGAAQSLFIQARPPLPINKDIASNKDKSTIPNPSWQDKGYFQDTGRREVIMTRKSNNVITTTFEPPAVPG